MSTASTREAIQESDGELHYTFSMQELLTIEES